MSAARRTPVLLIGLDAAEVTLVERWMNDGTLPNLAALRDRGGYGRLASTAEWLVGSPWPTFYTSSWPSEHGFVNYLQWRPDRMTYERPSDSWLPLRPFWRELAPQKLKTVVIDVPVTYPPTPYDGVELNGWGSHDKLWPPSACPPELLRRVYREFGAQPIGDETFGLQGVTELLRLRDDLVSSSGRVAGLALSLLDRYPWDLAMVVLGAAHRGGHRLWDDSGTLGRASSEGGVGFDTALRDVYRSCDAAVARLVAAAPSDALVFVFALHGMGPNDSRNALLPQMIDAVLAAGPAPEAPPRQLGRLLERARQAIPLEWRSRIKGRFPPQLQDRLGVFWRARGRDWTRTKLIAPIADREGYVQVNLKGREAQGSVDPADQAALLEVVAAGLKTFVDEDTGEPVVARVARPAELWPPGDRQGQVPDLLVRWTDSPARRHRAVVSPRHGRLGWPTPGKNPDGRSGHHRGTGWLIAAGPGVAAGTSIHDAHILDLAPTVLACLEAQPPFPMRGRALTLD